MGGSRGDGEGENESAFGRLRFGTPWRGSVLSMYQELHCLQSIHDTLLGLASDPEERARVYEHNQHCFNSMRQLLLCSAASSLELGDFMERDYETPGERYAGDLVCRDWTRIRDFAAENARDYARWAEEWN